MANKTRLGSIGGVQIIAERSVIFPSLVLWASALIVLWVALDLRLLPALGWATAALAVHWTSIFVHHFGHAAAARLSGHPMQALILTGPLGRDQYPEDEPELPVRVHAARALGGPIASLTAGGAVALWLLSADAANLTLRIVVGFGAAESLLVLGVGVFLPLGYTDGSTLLNLWRTGSP
ncbi:MAG: hypothetical protein R3191_00330 [Anaerolineales bacterium]|nr:hypothetical protein [Anaerolineales bacterium]